MEYWDSTVAAKHRFSSAYFILILILRVIRPIMVLILLRALHWTALEFADPEVDCSLLCRFSELQGNVAKRYVMMKCPVSPNAVLSRCDVQYDIQVLTIKTHYFSWYTPTIHDTLLNLTRYINPATGCPVFALGARPEEVTYMGFLVIASWKLLQLYDKLRVEIHLPCWIFEARLELSRNEH